MDIRNFFGGGAPKPAASTPASDASSKLKAKKPAAKKPTKAADQPFEQSNESSTKPAAKKRKTASTKGPAMTVEPPAPPKPISRSTKSTSRPTSKPTKQPSKQSSKSSKSVFSHMDDLDDEDQSDDDFVDDMIDDDFDDTPKKSAKSSKTQPIIESAKSPAKKSNKSSFGDDEELIDESVKPSKKSKSAAKKRRIVDDEEDLVDWGGDDEEQSTNQSTKQSTSQITKHFTTVTSEKELSKEEDERFRKEEAVRQESLKLSHEQSAKRSKRRGDLIDNDVVAPVINVPDSSVRKPSIKQSVKREINPMDFFSASSPISQLASPATEQSKSPAKKSPAKKSPAKSRVYSSPEVVDLDSDSAVEITQSTKKPIKQSATLSDAELAQQLQDEEDAKLRFVSSTLSKSPAKSTRSSIKSSAQSTAQTSKPATPNRKRKADVDIDLIDDEPPAKTIKSESTPKKSATPKKSKPTTQSTASESSTSEPSKSPAKSPSPSTDDTGADAYSHVPDPKKKGVPAWKSAASRASSLGMVKAIPEGQENCLSGLTFVVSGVLDSLEREEAQSLIQKYGGRVTGAISKKTNYLLCGQDAGESKLSKAKECKTKIIDEDALLEMIGTRKGQTVAPAAANSKAQAAAREVEHAAKAKAKAAREAAESKDNDVMHMKSTSHGRTVSEESSMLWVDKHKPLGVDGIIGNTGQIAKLGTYLAGWHSGLKHSSFNRAVLITGGPGIGKSTTAALVARERGFHVIELNASDVRSKKAIENVVGELTTNKSLTDYFGTSLFAGKLPKVAGRKTVLIMDEVDGISGNEDRGGTAALTQLIKRTQIPIICIANDNSSPKMRTLKNYCLCMTFARPQAKMAEPRLSAICKAEGLEASPNALEKLYEHTHGDLRATLNFLQMWKETHDTLNFDEVNLSMTTGAKDLDRDIFSCIPMLFRDPGRNPNWISDRESIYFLDSGLVPLFVQDGYLRARPRREVTFPGVKDGEVQTLMAISQAADSISDGDLMTSKIFGEQDYSFMPSHAMLSSIRPSWIMSGGSLSGGIDFPKWMGQNSSRNKRIRLLSEMKFGMQLDAPTTFSTLVCDYIPFFKDKLIMPLVGPDGAEHVDEVIDALDDYGMMREDWDTVMEVSKPLAPPRPDLDPETRTKSDFTRKYNKAEHQMKVSRMKMRGDDGISKGVGKASSMNADELEVNDVTVANDDDDEEGEEDTKVEATAVKDPMVKQVKPRATKAKSAKPAKAKAAKAARAKPTKAKPAAAKKKQANSDDDFIDDDSDFD